MVSTQKESKQSKKRQNRIIIKLRSYDPTSLDASASQIIDAASRTGAIVSGPVRMP